MSEPARAQGRGASDEGHILEAARHYFAAGWQLVPLQPRSKKPRYAGWPERRLLADELAAEFAGDTNLGALTGRATGGLVDVDLDAPEALAAAPDLLPRTMRIHGRQHKPASHYWYRVLPPAGQGDGQDPAPIATTKFAYAFPRANAGGPAAPTIGPTMLVELRGDGCQTMIPPSVHPGGERLVWQRTGEPGSVGEAQLRWAVAQVAACALLARSWPGQGQRDEAALALAGMLLRANWPVAFVDQFVTTTARVAGDEEWRQRAKARHTARRKALDEPYWGARTLAQRLAGGQQEGARVVAQVCTWLKIAGPWDEGGFLAPNPSPPPRGAEPTARPTAHAAPTARTPRAEGVLLSTVQEERVRWLWPGRIPLGKLTMLDGDPGLGKSLVTLDLIARVTTGRPMPDDSAGVDGGAVLLSAEDGLADTILPRLLAADADVRRVIAIDTVTVPVPCDGADTIMGGVGTIAGVGAAGGRPAGLAELAASPETFDSEHAAEDATGDAAPDPDAAPVMRRAIRLPDDVPLLVEHVRQVGAKLLVIDPLMAFLDPRVNSWRDQDARAALDPLVRLAREEGLAVIILRHLNKGGGTNAIYRGGGSVGLIGAARSGLLVAKDPDEPETARVLACVKGNLAQPVPALRFQVVSDGPDEPPHIAWLGPCAHTAEALLGAGGGAWSAGSGGGQKGMTPAAVWLREYLADGEEHEYGELKAAGAAEGFSEKLLRKARERLGVIWTKTGFGAELHSFWRLPADEQAVHADTKGAVAHAELD